MDSLGAKGEVCDHLHRPHGVGGWTPSASANESPRGTPLSQHAVVPDLASGPQCQQRRQHRAIRPVPEGKAGAIESANFRSPIIRTRMMRL